MQAVRLGSIQLYFIYFIGTYLGFYFKMPPLSTSQYFEVRKEVASSF
jgi:hypothetical protein